jgi:PKD repeat protein
MNINSLQQPAAIVESKGCTNSPVVLTSTTAGTIEWYFGNGTIPLYTSGQSVTVSFGTTGRKTFTMIVNGAAYTFTEFIDISNNQAANTINPTINSVDSILCAGNSGTYASSITGIAYYWKLFDENNLLIDTFPSNPGQTNAINFPYSGNYLLTLITESACCGKSFPDSFHIQVDTILPVGIVISSSEQDNGDTVCQGAFITFSAAAQNAGLNPQYQWRVNGATAGSGPTFSSSTLASGSTIDCVVTSSEFCSFGQTAASNQITVTVISAPIVSCTADSLVANEPTYFFAEVSSGGVGPFEYNWDFGDNFTGYGDSVQHLYTDKGSYSVNVIVTDINGCVGACSTVVTILEELAANFSADKLQGCAPFAVAFTNLSTNAVNYLWDFGDGQTSVVTNPVHIYQASGDYTVTLDAFGGTGSLTQQVNNQVSVLPSPTAQAQAYPNEIKEQGDTVFFADNSFNAWSWFWDFGDGSTSTEQNPIHIYQDNGCYSVFLAVTNEYGCSDTIFLDDFVCKTVGIDDNSIVSGIFPNPFQNKVEITVPSLATQCKVELFDLSGKKMELSVQIQASNQIIIETPNLAEGTYLLKIISEKGLWVERLVHTNDLK